MAQDTSAFVAALETITPLALGESWDNVGLLIDRPRDGPIKRVLLTNDLTEWVLAEAIAQKVDFIVSYHPTPFRSFKKITRGDVVGRVVMGCISNNIGVFSPHTAADSVVGGVTDWLASGLGAASSCVPLTPSDKIEGAGSGRLLTLTDAVPLSEIAKRVKEHLGLPHLRIGLPKQFAAMGSDVGRETALAEYMVKTVAMCPGSGASVMGGTAADVYLTGEMSHHEVLAASAAGVCVLLTEHSNCERGWLELLKEKIAGALGGGGAGGGEGGAGPEICISAIDADPIQTI